MDQMLVHLLLQEFPEQHLYARCEELMQEESHIVKALPWRAALHSL